MNSDYSALAKLLLPDDVDAIRRRVESVGQGKVESVPAYWASAGLGFSGIAASGRLIGWTMFPAPDEATAVETSRAQFELVVSRAMQATERAAAGRFQIPDGSTAH